MSDVMEIARLGLRGDGVTPDGIVVPGALPGETVRAEPEEGTRPARARLDAVLNPSTDRIDPFCPYFGTCGGCAIQHLAPAPYAEWKRDLVVGALARAGIEAPVAPLLDAHGLGRRRITLHVRAAEGGPQAGFMAARSHALVAIDHCPITEAALHRAPEVARALSRPLGGGKPLDVQVTATAGGLDVDIRGHGPASERARQTLVRLAGDLDLARLSLHGDVLIVRRLPEILAGRARLVPPAGGFLQATAEGEAVLARLVVEGVGKAKRVADLFSGAGAFSLALAEGRSVHAVEGEAGALTALDRAFRETPGLRTVTTERRDLFRRPLLAPELDRYDAVVFDPPRAGAEAQSARIAESKVPVVVGVSCDAGSFARDAALLVRGGYRLEAVTPVDQFRHSPHVEIVGVFRRPGKKR
ncbi:class I SAM-dependent RNA methyltransferase [Methylobacterium nonmethylotrophicum]|uniref:Class I SAM-dependent RNA methyltransferase n=1 Tax=Methylobacterium nonmethylotrophicum TaxID=1141884 RepID=A0A4Z0NE15_9HYPH|nr:class I SAM-dependent RNA methyltransferase [Methylobacterium nonmethylotrophicum]TGD92515.1 class I SAM-dependent RNA methyltransferase [Methylobacterium nonmethylotrophicum]